MGYIVELRLDVLKAKTVRALAMGSANMMDKDFIEWLDAEHQGITLTATQQAWDLSTGSGAFIPEIHE